MGGCFTPSFLSIFPINHPPCRKYLIYDMDGFTKEFYRRNFGVEDFEPLDVGLADAKPVEQVCLWEHPCSRPLLY